MKLERQQDTNKFIEDSNFILENNNKNFGNKMLNVLIKLPSVINT